MTGGVCTSCGTPLEADAGFCANCGTAVGGTGGAPHQAPAGPPACQPMPPVLMRPPRNPRQTASFAAAVMVAVAGIFCLLFGNVILYWDALDTFWDAQLERDVTVVETGAMFSGILFVAAFAVSLVSAYCAFRLTRHQLAVAGPVMLMVAYFGALAYEAYVLIATVYIFILAVVSLVLLYYAIPIYEGRNVREVEAGIRVEGPLMPPAR